MDSTVLKTLAVAGITIFVIIFTVNHAINRMTDQKIKISDDIDKPNLFDKKLSTLNIKDKAKPY